MRVLPYIKVDLVLPVGRDLLLISDNKQCIDIAQYVVRGFSEVVNISLQDTSQVNTGGYEITRYRIDLQNGVDSKGLALKLSKQIKQELSNQGIQCNVFFSQEAQLSQQTELALEVSGILAVGELHLDLSNNQLFIGNNRIDLTSMECRLLSYFMKNPNQMLSPSHLLETIWEYPPNTGDPDLVRAHIRNLRSKIERDDKQYIRISGMGYMLSVTD